jgi:hypothetical protein
MSRFDKALILLIGLISTLITAGCISNVQTSTAPSTKSPNITSPDNIPTSATITPGSTQATPGISTSTPVYPHTLKKNLPLPPAYIKLSIPVLPKPGETADLIININFIEREKQFFPEGIENAGVWTEFYWTSTKGSYSEAKQAILIPPSKVMVEGLTSWGGDLVYNIQSSCKIRLPLEGVWQIKSFFASEKYETIWSGLYFASLDGYAVKLTHGGNDDQPSYLRNFEYGMQSPLTLSEDMNPIILEADISKPPKVGEEAVITCRIRSLNDVPDFSAQFKFFKRRIDVDGAFSVPPDKLLVQGNLSWKGDLKANQSTVFSATIKFPETGEWEVYASGNSSERKANQMSGFAESIHMNITNDVSSYGWEKREPKSPNK